VNEFAGAEARNRSLNNRRVPYLKKHFRFGQFPAIQVRGKRSRLRAFQTTNAKPDTTRAMEEGSGDEDGNWY
jgi:hypothetical protein